MEQIRNQKLNYSSGFHQIIRKQFSLIQRWKLHQISALPYLSFGNAPGERTPTLVPLRLFLFLDFRDSLFFLNPQRPGLPSRALGTEIKKFYYNCTFFPFTLPNHSSNNVRAGQMFEVRHNEVLNHASAVFLPSAQSCFDSWH